MSTTRPYYRRRRPSPTLHEGDVHDDGTYVDLDPITTPGFADADPVAAANASFDDRAAAVIAAATGLGDVDAKGWPRLRSRSPISWTGSGDHPVPQQPWYHEYDLCEFKWYSGPTGRYLLRSKCLPVMAYLDYFPGSRWTNLRSFVSSVIPTASPGYCGTFGPDVDSATDLALQDPLNEGNYDMNQMFLIPIAYRYFDQLSPVAREHLITVLLGRGRVHRPRRTEGFTSGPVPSDWSRAGFVSPLGVHRDIGETENHILMMLTTRYLTNQLLWQRHHIDHYDNRRNGGNGAPSCLDLVLSLLRNILRGDFSEYNAKNYQEETRHALLNLCSYAYDHEVRLGARMVLDYVSAKMAVSSNDLRRMLPFRRRNEGNRVARRKNGVMKVSLLSEDGADPLGPYYAMQAGNTRSCAVRLSGSVSIGPGPLKASTGEVTRWGIPKSRHELALEVLSEYRLPPSVHDLFVNDRHRRFFQRLHRFPKKGEAGGNRNADNMEIYAGSPSYLITAGGQPAPHAIDPRFAGFVVPGQDQQLGVAVTTSFIPTTHFGGSTQLVDRAEHVIQFGSFSSTPPPDVTFSGAANYGIAPDFACGHQVYLPPWVGVPAGATRFHFVNKESVSTGTHRGPGFFLAILKDDGMALLEALDTWLHPEVTFDDFRAGVLARNGGLRLRNNQPAQYTTSNGNRLEFVIWRAPGRRRDATYGAEVLSMTYGGVDKADQLGNAGNTKNRFLNGTVINSGPEAVIEIRNPFLGTKLRLDMSDRWHPRRTAEDGAVISAGANEEVWADFDWKGPSKGDVCRPFATVAAASAAVAPHGTIRLIPSVSHERTPIGVSKRFRLVAPIGDVTIGA